ncbi:unnamed protein product, partial [Callosobruchus maculatus]
FCFPGPKCENSVPIPTLCHEQTRCDIYQVQVGLLENIREDVGRYLRNPTPKYH